MKELENILLLLKDRLRNQDRHEIQDLIQHQESVLALETLVTQLDEFETPITPSIKARLLSLIQDEGLGPRYRKILQGVTESED